MTSLVAAPAVHNTIGIHLGHRSIEEATRALPASPARHLTACCRLCLSAALANPFLFSCLLKSLGRLRCERALCQDKGESHVASCLWCSMLGRAVCMRHGRYLVRTASHTNTRRTSTAVCLILVGRCVIRSICISTRYLFLLPGLLSAVCLFTGSSALLALL